MNYILIAVFQIFMLFVLIMTSISLGYVSHDEVSSIINEYKYNKVNTLSECENKSMSSTAYCLNKYVRSIFKYKSRKDIETPTLEELKLEGGDCKDWTELYIEMISDLGFDVKQVMINSGNNSRHTFAVISDESGYCVLDQKSVDCFWFDTLNNSEF